MPMSKYLRLMSLLFCFYSFSASAVSDTTIVDNNAQTHHSHDSTSFFLYYPWKNQINDQNIDFDFFNNNINFFVFSYLKNNSFSLSNGNLGSFYKDFSASQFHDYCAYDLNTNYNTKLFTPDNIPYVISELPATNAFYSMGKNKEQFFNLFHTQKIDSSTSFSINYNVENSAGLYKNQKANNSRFFTYFNYYNDSNKYSLISGFINNSITQFENGGITNPNSQFQDTTIYDRQFTDVNLNSAVNSFKKSTFFYNQNYKVDGLNPKKPLYFSNAFEYSAYYRLYENDFEDFYFFDNVLVNPTNTRDSINVRFLKSKFLVSNYNAFNYPDSIKFKYFAGYFFDKINTRNDLAREKYFHHGLMSGFSYGFSDNSKLTSLFELSYHSSNIANTKPFFELEVDYIYTFNSDFLKWFNISTTFKLEHPLWIHEHYYSNHFIWENDFENQKVLQTEALLSTKLGKLNIRWENLSNIVYFNSSSLPTQSEDKATNILNLNYQWNFSLNKFVFSGIVGYQKADDSTFIRIPNYYSTVRFGFETPLFNNALIFFVGTEAYYFSKFYADVWSPAIMGFNIQNNVEIGNYIYPNFFISARVKKTKFFAMIENFTSGFLPINYYAMPAYPRNDLFFRWGISWSFYN